MSIDLNTWIISDTHFGHYNMIKTCGRPLNFNEKIANNWDWAVRKDDTVLHLGDLSMWHGPAMGIWLTFAEQRPGKKLMILGNHDEFPVSFYEDAGYKVLKPFTYEILGKLILFSHYPTKPNGWWDINIHGHIHNNDPHEGERDFELTDRHINVSIEVMNYKPVKLGDIIK